VSAADYLGWGARGVAGYYGTSAGRDLNLPGGHGAASGSQGHARLPKPKAKRFSVNYHLLAVREDAARVRVQVWLDEGQSVPSVISVWPTADWHEREAWDLFGIRFDGHPNPTRILMDEDWEGHPLRKDYPLGGEPVRFTNEE
jgi:NADH/F420H2 dehydrogenase subunit C